jgi:hypothetical protein
MGRICFSGFATRAGFHGPTRSSRGPALYEHMEDLAAEVRAEVERAQAEHRESAAAARDEAHPHA